MGVLCPSLYFGVPVLAHKMRKFDPEFVIQLLSKHSVRNAFLPPTALQMMRKVKDLHKNHAFQLRTLISGGQSLGQEMFDWAKEALGVRINEGYGQTEVHFITGNCGEIMDLKPGSVGRTLPGRKVKVMDDLGNPVPPGDIGQMAVQRPDPIMFLGYWKNPEATEKRFIGDWCMTGDNVRQDEDGYFWFSGREDDMIKSSGYRIGPDEVENCLTKHPAVYTAGVIGSPDEIRGQIVKAYIVPVRGINWKDPSLKEDIQQHVKKYLTAYAYPREIEFVQQSLPLSITGKVVRKELRKWDLEKKEG
jgi:acetyl-CoA synthetase